jgi:hypothetical protein
MCGAHSFNESFTGQFPYNNGDGALMSQRSLGKIVNGKAFLFSELMKHKELCGSKTYALFRFGRREPDGLH